MIDKAKLDVIAISGSLRKASYNTALLRAAQGLAPADMAIELAEGIGDYPLYNADVQAQGIPAGVTALAERIKAVDGVLIACPEYNYSIAAPLKNAIDWLSRVTPQPFAGKAVCIVGAGAGMLGTGRAQYHLRQCFVFLDGLVMTKPEVFVAAAHTKFDANGGFNDDMGKTTLKQTLDAFGKWIRKVG